MYTALLQAAVLAGAQCGLLALTTNLFYGVNRTAGQLAVPAFVWSAFGMYVCVKLYQLNKPPPSKKNN